MSAYAVRFVPRASAVPDILWTGCFAAELEGRWWYEALEHSALDQFEFAYAILYDDARPVGVAPLFVMDVPLALIVPPVWMPMFRILGRFGRVFRAQRTLFVGSPCSDEGTVGLLPGVERERRAPMLVWKDFPASYDAELGALSAASGMFRLESFPGTATELPGPRPGDYYAALRANHRSNIKRKLKRGAAALPLDVAIMTRPDAAALDEIFALFWQTYEKASTRFERLNRRFFEVIAQCAQSHFVVLRTRGDGKMVAFMLCFLLDGKAINKFIGIDYRRTPEAFLYFRLWDAALTWACGAGAGLLQSGQTGYSAKLLLEHRLQPLTNWCVHRNRLVHAVYRHVAGAVSWATLDPDLALHLAAHPRSALAVGATPAVH
jgi:hypothetical protein